MNLTDEFMMDLRYIYICSQLNLYFYLPKADRYPYLSKVDLYLQYI